MRKFDVFIILGLLGVSLALMNLAVSYRERGSRYKYNIPTICVKGKLYLRLTPKKNMLLIREGKPVDCDTNDKPRKRKRRRRGR
jgi:hypothetical protein